MKYAVLDIETDGINPDNIWVIVVKELDTGQMRVFSNGKNLNDFKEYASTIDKFIMHNGISYDAFYLNKLLNVHIPVSKIIDTLVLSRLVDPSREGGHSLASWGERFGMEKISFNNWEALSQEMIKYCMRDVDITTQLYEQLKEDSKDFSQQSKDLEHAVAKLIDIQSRNGFYLKQKEAAMLVASLQEKSTTLSNELVDMFPPKEVQLKTKIKYIPFNPNSRQQIGEKLIELGWVPTTVTDKTQKPVVNEKTLASCPLPVARKFQQLFLLNKRLAQINSWIEAVNPSTKRVHGYVKTVGTITGRMSHYSPNMAQVPSSSSPYGKECRQLWSIENPKQFRLVGADASGLELRCLAHYMDDSDFTKEVVDGDIHTVNQKATGLPDRDTAKTFIYAFLYGGGPFRIGSIVGGGVEEGRQLINRFLSNMPKLAELRQKVTTEAELNGKVRGLDGRYINVRHQHAALNTLLQGAGAIICKQWLWEICKLAKHHQLKARPVANIHDEVQFEVVLHDAQQFMAITRQAMKQAEKVLNVRCPLDSEAKIGISWDETH